MFIYLSKKIGIPNNTKLNCLAWSKQQSYIACGGDDGLLKVLRLDAVKDGKLSKNLATPSNLAINQTLEGHQGRIEVVTWNENHHKLTTSDQYGLIIVWMLYKGSWCEEMINNRNKSVVKGMAWNSDGQKICIVYEDGAVIVGSVDGNRIWGKELKGVTLTGVVWSPDSKLLLFSLLNGEIHIYDNQGNFTMKLNVQCISSNPLGLGGGDTVLQVVGMDWYDGHHGYVEEDCPVLAICFQNGCMQIMRGENDDLPVLIDTGMVAVSCCWNHNGSVIAVTGIMQLPPENKDCNVIQFFGPFGEHLRTLKIPGNEVSGCSWEGGSLRIAIAVDSYIYFANIRPNYRWTYFAHTVVYCFQQPNQPGVTVCFWDTNNNECHNKSVKYLLGIVSFGDHCVLSTKADENTTDGQFGLILCNAIGTPVDAKYMDIEPLCVALNSTHVFAASRDNFLLWHYKTPRSRSTVGIPSLRHYKERLYHIDDTPSGVAEVIHDLDHTYEPTTNLHATADPICCIAVSEKILLIGRESGTVQRYSLPQVALTNRYTLNCRPYRLAINCNSTRLAVVDITGILTLLDLEQPLNPIFSSSDGSSNMTVSKNSLQDVKNFERKDVWELRWASDNPELLAILEKMRMYVIRGIEPEEPIVTSGYICSFKDLEIRVVLLDEVMQNPEHPITDYIMDLEVKSLRDTRSLLTEVGITETRMFIEENPHPRLWRLLAEAAMEKLDFTTAEAAFVRCNNYPGIQFVKQILNIHNDTLKKAEISAYFKHFNDAEKYYLEADRRDLAISLREKLGDWFRVVQLIIMGAGGSDTRMKFAWNSIGDFFADRQNWSQAREYYEKGHNVEKVIMCYYMIEDYQALDKTSNSLPENHPLLSLVVDLFVSVGMCSQAVNAYLKYGKVKAAVDTCIFLNQWDQAVLLAQEYKLPEIGTLLSKYASYLLDRKEVLAAVELYRKANHFIDAAKVLNQVAKEEAKKRTSPLRMKKLYVLLALLIEERREYSKKNAPPAYGDESGTIIELLANGTHMAINAQILDNPWHGAEAYHFLMLAQRQLYDGYVDEAMKTALHLREYEDIIKDEDIYCILALASCANKAFGTCSKSFIKLESLSNVPQEKLEEYQMLAMDIFTKYSPKDTDLHSSRSECASCETMIPDWCGICPNCETTFPICIVTGRSLMNPDLTWMCSTCKHSAAEQYMAVRKSCPLCHAALHT